MDNKLPYKIFLVVMTIVLLVTFLVMNYNSTNISFIFFTIKVPLTIIFFIFIILGAIISSLFWYEKYKTIKVKCERIEKLLFSKEKTENGEEDGNKI